MTIALSSAVDAQNLQTPGMEANPSETADAAFRLYLAVLLGPAWLDPQVAVTHHEGLLLSQAQHMLHVLRVGKLHKPKVGAVIASDLRR